MIETVPDVIGIVGSRGPDPERGRVVGWTDYPLVLRLCTRIQQARRQAGSAATIISGGAPSGVDRHVQIACRNLAFCFGEHLRTDPASIDCPMDHFHEIEAEWRGKNGKGPLNRLAGFERNDKLVRHCLLVVALFAPGEQTPGTTDVIKRCRTYDIPVLIYHEGVWR